MSTNQETQAISETATQTTPAAQAQSNAQAQRAGNQGNKPRRQPLVLRPDQSRRLEVLIAEKLKNPYAALELLTALEAPGARFVGVENGVSAQILKVLQDTDRGLSALDRISVMDLSLMNDRHSIEKGLATVLQSLVNVTAEIAVLANKHPNTKRPVQVLDVNVKAAIKAKAGAEPGQLQAA